MDGWKLKGLSPECFSRWNHRMHVENILSCDVKCKLNVLCMKTKKNKVFNVVSSNMSPITYLITFENIIEKDVSS